MNVKITGGEILVTPAHVFGIELLFLYCLPRGQIIRWWKYWRWVKCEGVLLCAKDLIGKDKVSHILSLWVVSRWIKLICCMSPSHQSPINIPHINVWSLLLAFWLQVTSPLECADNKSSRRFELASDLVWGKYKWLVSTVPNGLLNPINLAKDFLFTVK